MKKIFLIFVLFIGACYTNALELTYSEWSEKYPKGVDEILIESEDRYLWYKETIYDVEYLRIEDAINKIYDINDYEYYESEELFEKPEEYSERNIIEYDKSIVYSSIDAHGLIFKSDNDVLISEIVIYDENRNLVDYNDSNSYLKDGNKDVYYPLNKELSITFNHNYDMNNLSIYVYYNYYGNDEAHLKANIISKDNDIIYYADYYFEYCNSFGCSFDVNKNVLFNNFNHHRKAYIYIDKLYKTYRINREYASGYYSELEGYDKDIESKKTFYRYITNKYLLFDAGNNIMTDESWCEKEFCMIVFFDTVVEEDDPIIDNPSEVIEPIEEEPIVDIPPEIEEPIIENHIDSETPSVEEPFVEVSTELEEPIIEKLPDEESKEDVAPTEEVIVDTTSEIEEPIVEKVITEESIKENIVPLNNYVEESIDDLIINPKTYDPLYDYIVLFIISLIAVSYFIVEKSRTNKKSNNVETI